MRKFLIKILLRLVTPTTQVNEVDDKKIAHWLEMEANDLRINEYLKMRTIALLKTLGAGISQEQYTEIIGRRLELLTLLQKIDDARKGAEKKRKLQDKKLDTK